MSRGSEDDTAFQLDLYLDRVLSGAVASVAMDDVPAAEPALAAAVGALERGAARFHPSFRFEERLAQRLRHVASGTTSVDVTSAVPRTTGVPGEVDVPGVLVPFGPVTAADRPRTYRRVGGVIVGGAIASGVSLASLAGAAALMVWRRARWERLV